MTTGSGQDAATIPVHESCAECDLTGTFDADYRDGAATWDCPVCGHVNRTELEGNDP